MMGTIGVMHYLIFAFVLFAAGIFMVISSRNLLKMFIGIEFMLNAVMLNFASINVYSVHINHTGQIFAVFTAAVSAIELAVVIVLFTAAFKKIKTIDAEDYRELREEA